MANGRSQSIKKSYWLFFCINRNYLVLKKNLEYLLILSFLEMCLTLLVEETPDGSEGVCNTFQSDGEHVYQLISIIF